MDTLLESQWQMSRRWIQEAGLTIFEQLKMCNNQDEQKFSSQNKTEADVDFSNHVIKTGSISLDNSLNIQNTTKLLSIVQ